MKLHKMANPCVTMIGVIMCVHRLEVEEVSVAFLLVYLTSRF